MSTERFETSLAFVLKWEGSKFTNDPDDSGGPTRFGITQREYEVFRERQELPARSVESITMDEVREIYRSRYWETVEGDNLEPPLDMVAFDTAVLMGIKKSIKFFQQSLGVRVDGAIGPETRGALARADGVDVAEKVMDLREQKLHGIVMRRPSQAKFLKGWLNRLNDLRRTVVQTGTLELALAPEPEEEELRPEEDLAMGRASLDLEDFERAGESAFGEGDAEEDPAAPEPYDLEGVSEEVLAEARNLANFGREEWAREIEDFPGVAAEVEEESPGMAATAEAALTIPIDLGLAQAFLDACTNAVPRVSYGLGAKVPFHGAIPGTDFKKVDCSGFVREAIWQATSPHRSFPDGSVVQHDWIRARSFERSTPAAALQQDGVIRIAFLSPQDSPQHIGHVVLVHDARTLESHGGVGPDSRPWTNTGWQAKAFIYVLVP